MDLLSLGIGLGAGAGATYAAKFLRERQKQPSSLTGALGWAHLVDADRTGGEYAAVVLKDGGLMRGWRYRGPDPSGATTHEVNTLAAQINEALRPLGTGWLLDASAVRRGADTYAAAQSCHFPTEGLRFLDDLRRQRYTGGAGHFETEYILCATYLPPKEIYSKLGSIFIEGRGTGEVDWNMLLKRFRNESSALARRLEAQLTMEPLGPSGLMTHLHECLTGKSHPVAYNPHSNPYLASELASEDMVGGFSPRMGDKYVRVISTRGLPNRTRPGQTHFLGSLPFSFRWHTRFMPYSRSAAEEEISGREQEWFRKRQGASALTSSGEPGPEDEKLEELSRDRDALRVLEGISEAKAKNASGEVSFGRFTTTIVVMEEDEQHAEYVASEIVGALADRGFPAQIENVNATDAFFGSLPGHGSYNLRRPLVSTRNMADLMPTTGIWPGEKENPSDLIPDAPALMWAKTEGSTPFRVNLHSGDVGHGFCIGATGAGKSVLVGSLAQAWMRYAGAQVYIFDVGYSHYLMHLLAGGEHYDIGGGSGEVKLQPLRQTRDRSYRAFAKEWLEVLFDVQGRSLTPEQKESMGRAVRQLGRVEDPGERTMLKLKTLLSEDQALQSVISEYTAIGSYGELLDASRDSIGEGGFQVFEVGHLLDKGDEIVVPVLYYLFQRIEEQLSATRPTLIVIEEAWAALMRGLFADKLKAWLATLRKKNGAVFMVAHSPSQLKDDQIRNVEMLTENIPTRFFLPNPNARSEEARDIYRSFGLNGREIERLAKAQKKRDYYYSNPNLGGRMFQLGLSPAELAFMGTAPGRSMEETIAEARRLREEHGERWVAPWLRLCGARESAEKFEEAFLEKRGTSEEKLFGWKENGRERPDAGSPAAPPKTGSASSPSPVNAR